MSDTDGIVTDFYILSTIEETDETRDRYTRSTPNEEEESALKVVLPVIGGIATLGIIIAVTYFACKTNPLTVSQSDGSFSIPSFSGGGDSS